MKRLGIALLIVLIVVCAVGSSVYRKFQEGAEAAAKAKQSTATVERGDLVLQVVETGSMDAVKAVEVKSRASGRLAKLYVDEGDTVKAGQLIATIDPQETALRVEQDRAQVRGAKSGVERLNIEISQRQVMASAALRQAKSRVVQLEAELKIQPRLTGSAIRSAQATLNSLKTERRRLVENSHPSARTSAETNLEDAKANVAQAEREYTRQETLLKQGYVPSKSLENAKLQLDLAHSRARQAQDTYDRLAAQQRSDLAKMDEEIARAEADLDRTTANGIQDANKKREYESALDDLRKAESSLRDVDALKQSREQSLATIEQLSSVLRDSERQLGETEIRAPLDGIVTKKFVQEGELVAALSGFNAGTPIIKIEDRRTLMVKLAVNEIDVARIKLGMPSKIEVDALPGKTFEGSIKKIAPASTATMGAGGDVVVKYAVEVWLKGSDPMLRSGMSAKVSLEVSRRDKVLFLPAEYIGKNEKGESFIELPTDPKKKDAKPIQQVVKTGLSTGSRVEILSGVAEGTKVGRPKFTGPPRKGFMQAGPDEE